MGKRMYSLEDLGVERYDMALLSACINVTNLSRVARKLGGQLKIKIRVEYLSKMGLLDVTITKPKSHGIVTTPQLKRYSLKTTAKGSQLLLLWNKFILGYEKLSEVDMASMVSDCATILSHILEEIPRWKLTK
jgi:hypothetical protein